ncbi:hypothetical protein F4824DRAFT_495638 [Ustulina deusta]|nr:hypothetical protein F4824DRAFT_495638 [Ustulina deusta]
MDELKKHDSCRAFLNQLLYEQISTAPEYDPLLSVHGVTGVLKLAHNKRWKSFVRIKRAIMIAITPNVNITKKDEFMIAETEETFSNGVGFGNSTTAVKISFDQKYTLPRNWEDGSISKQELHGNSFIMTNNTTDVASYLFTRLLIAKTSNSTSAPLLSALEAAKS